MLHYQNRRTKRLSKLRKFLKFYTLQENNRKAYRIKRIVQIECVK